MGSVDAVAIVARVDGRRSRGPELGASSPLVDLILLFVTG